MKIFVEDYGAKSDGSTLCTGAVQAAIDACGAGGGGEVCFSAGRYVCSTVFLRSGVHIVVGKGAQVLGSLNFSDYRADEPKQTPCYQDASHSFFHCSLFVAEDCEDVGISGGGDIDMRSVWDEQNVRDMAHRGAKCIAMKNCRKVRLAGVSVRNVTDLAVYCAGCEDVMISRLKLRVHIDGISPDNCNRVTIADCDVESGDDGIVFKSSYVLDRIGVCENVTVKRCRIKSCCSAIKFGTESIGGFRNFTVEDVRIRDTWLAGIAVESVDGAVIDGLTFRNIRMKNVGGPLFVHLGNRLRAPEGRTVGEIRNLIFENIRVEGPYKRFDAFAWNYDTFRSGNLWQFPYLEKEEEWRNHKGFTSNVCGLPEKPLENIRLKKVLLTVPGGISERLISLEEGDASGYPEIFVYGETLPAKGIFFRHVRGLECSEMRVTTERADARDPFVFDDVETLIFR